MVLLLGVVALWIAIHRIPGLGPRLADAARAALGPEAVAWMEDTAYGAEDWVFRQIRRGERAEPAFAVPARPAASARAAAAGAAPGPEPYRPDDLRPMYAEVAAEGEGAWVPIADPRRPGDPVRMYKAFLHPDRVRAWSVVSIVAADLGQIEIHAVAGRHVPESRTPEAKSYERRAVVPAEHQGRLLAAFNGGYLTTHGYYGMKIDGVTLVRPRPLACVVAKYSGDRLVIRPWEKVEQTEPEMLWYRQTPVCMYDQGKPAPGLSMAKLGWGSAPGASTVIRRSAIGLSRDGRVLYVGIADFTTARAVADAMVHAGAYSVAQLDVN
ncbi:MAG: hypothetical protein HY744_11035, partial [Deltaproteobacteria bacterium]|nr:hypothetical protein [Deltaproteobacteria bacterium]